ncbi:MAG: hypothetical protein ACREAD_00605 [Nitrosopumilaceae archaeon]
MGFVHIAFIECVLDGAWHPKRIKGLDDLIYETGTDNAEISLVDLGLTRRYYSFRTNSEVTIANNVLIFRDDHGTLEMRSDDSKKFSNKPKIND